MRTDFYSCYNSGLWSRVWHRGSSHHLIGVVDLGQKHVPSKAKLSVGIKTIIIVNRIIYYLKINV